MKRDKVRILLSVLALVFLAGHAPCQDPHYSQFYAAQLYLNPAFTGSSGGSRLIANYRHQWAGIPGAFPTYAFSFDHSFDRISSGAGVYFSRDKAGSGGLRTTIAGVQYAYHVKLSRKMSARFGADVSYRVRDVNFSDLIFNDQLSKSGVAPSTTETPMTENASFFDYGAGALLYNQKYWLGLSAHHLTKPDQSLVGGNESLLPMKYAVHGGARLPVKDAFGKKSGNYLAPAFSYKGQHDFDQLDVGLSYYSNPVTIGIWYRGIPGLKAYKPGYGNNDALVGLIGYKVDRLSFGYSYDVTISKLAVATSLGAHEISLIYEFDNRNKEQKKGSKKPVIIPCAKF